MKPELQRLYDYFIIDRTHRALRVPCEVDFAALFSKENLCDEERMCRRFETVMAMETPRILPDEKIVLTRSVSDIGHILTDKEEKKLAKEYYIHGTYVNNICPHYADVIQNEMLTECEYVTRGIYRGDATASEALTDEERAEIADAAKDWTLLLQLSTIEKEGFELMWGDCGMLYFYIKKQDLAARRFENAWFLLQCW